MMTNDAMPGLDKIRPSYNEYRDMDNPQLKRIPVHWDAVRLKTLARLTYGNTLANDERVDGDVPVHGSNGVVGIHDTPNTLAPAIVIGRKGSFGKVAYSNLPAFAIDTTYFIDRRASAAHLRWLYYALLTLGLDQISQDTGVPGLSRDTAYDQVVPLPLDGEQHAIAVFLDRETAALDTLVGKKRRLIALLEEKRAALIARAVTRGLDPEAPTTDSGVGWLGAVPAHWAVRRLKAVTNLVTSGSRGWSEYYADEGSIFLRIGNLSRTSIDLDLGRLQHVLPPLGTEGERTRVQQHDVLVSITAYIGSVAVVDRDLGEAYVNQHIALIRPRRDSIVARWLGYSLLSPVGQYQLRSLLYGGTKDGLGLDDVRNLFILAPPRPEQELISNYLDHETAKLDALIAKLRETIARLGERRTALIAAAVTGQIDVRGEVGTGAG